MCEMVSLIQFRPVFGIACLALGLSLSQSCARSEPHPSVTATPVSPQKLPFHPAAGHASAGQGTHPAVPPDTNSLDANSIATSIETTSIETTSIETTKTSALPFRSHAHILPSGTLLTVQLENSLSTAKVRDGDTFTASVAAPLTIDGDPLVERGAVATGHIESVRAQAGSGYFELRLSALTVEGRQLALQTTSLFTRGTSEQPDEVRVQKGRHLTFRLTSPVTLNEPKSIANR
jgi:hypothetical protein